MRLRTVVAATEAEELLLVRTTEVDEEVFGLDRPVRGESVFETTADGVADAEVVVVVPAEAVEAAEQEVVVVGVREGVAIGRTTGRVDHEHRREGVADTATSRAEEAVVALIGIAEQAAVVANAEGRTVLRVGLETEHDRAGLPVIADLTTTDERNVVAVAVAAEAEVVAVIGVGAETGTGVETNVEARPGKHRRRCDVGGRRAARRKIGGDRGTGERNRACSGQSAKCFQDNPLMSLRPSPEIRTGLKTSIRRDFPIGLGNASHRQRIAERVTSEQRGVNRR